MSALQFSPVDSLVFDALGSPVRRQIVAVLSERPHAVGDLAKLFPVSRPAVSKHLKLLEKAGLVAHDQVGNRNLYRLDRVGFDAARSWLNSFWSDALNRFRMVAENSGTENG